MRYGIDFRAALLSGAGIGRYTREICRAMAPLLRADEELVLYGSSMAPVRMPADELRFFSEHPSIRLNRIRFPNRILNLLGRISPISLEMFTGKLDLFLYSDFVYPKVGSKTLRVMMLFDLLFMDRGAGYHSHEFCETMATRVERALKKADTIIVPSDAVRDDLNHYFPDIASRVSVIPLGGDHLDSLIPKEKTICRRPFFLSVGTLEPRKNRLGLLRAFEALADDVGDADLLIVGKKGWMNDDFDKALAASPVKDRVRVLNQVDDADLVPLYQQAIAQVYPSLGEGFGLPVAEAMALGCPVITSERTSMPQVAGGAALLVDPENINGLAEAMKSLALDPNLRQDHIERGKKRAGSLTWNRAAADTLDLFRNLVLPESVGG